MKIIYNMANLKTLSLIGWIGTFCTIKSLWLSTQEFFYFLIVKVLFFISNKYFANIANSQLHGFYGSPTPCSFMLLLTGTFVQQRDHEPSHPAPPHSSSLGFAQGEVDRLENWRGQDFV
jgi:hypothetical protein